MSQEEWDQTPWWVQRAYLEGMEEDESVPISFEGGGGRQAAEEFAKLPPGEGPSVREGVDAGVHVIDLKAMRSQLEAKRDPGEVSDGL